MKKNILANLQNYLIGKTTFVIAHRIFTSWTFDQIIILDNGAIAEQGNHEQLMELNGRYAKLYPPDKLVLAVSTTPSGGQTA